MRDQRYGPARAWDEGVASAAQALFGVEGGKRTPSLGCKHSSWRGAVPIVGPMALAAVRGRVPLLSLPPSLSLSRAGRGVACRQVVRETVASGRLRVTTPSRYGPVCSWQAQHGCVYVATKVWMRHVTASAQLAGGWRIALYHHGFYGGAPTWHAWRRGRNDSRAALLPAAEGARSTWLSQGRRRAQPRAALTRGQCPGARCFTTELQDATGLEPSPCFRQVRGHRSRA